MADITFTQVTKTFEEYAQQVVDLQRNFLVSKGKVASGDLVNSIGYQIVNSAKGKSIEFLADDYWVYVEYGRRAGDKFPPPQPIAQWIRERRIRPNAGVTQQQLVYLISRAIADKGIRPTPFVEASEQAVLKFIEGESLLQAFEEDVLNNIPNEIK